MLRVLMLSWEYPPALVGGLARHVHSLSVELSRQGYEVTVLTLAPDGSPSDSVVEGVRVIRVRPYFQLPADFRLWVLHLNFALLEEGSRLLRGLDGPMILHAHDWLVAHAARGLKHLYRIPLVATIHATEHGRQGGIHDQGQQYINDVEWWLTYEAWRVIVCSHAMKGEVGRLFSPPDDKLAVIPNGISIVSSAAGVSRERFAAPEERLIFHLGRLVPEKGARVLLEAVARLRTTYRLRLVIGGVGPQRAELEQMADHLGIADRVAFLGWIEDSLARSLYSLADAVVVPSLYEPFGIVALEAMIACAPLVVSDLGGLAEIVEHGVNGLKATPGDPSSLAHQLDRLLQDSTLARRLGQEASRQAVERYSWANVALATAQLYSAVMDSAALAAWDGMPAREPEVSQPGSRSESEVLVRESGDHGRW